MARKKWGESFLKSGLPLEHVTLVTFRSSGFDCYPNVEYSRQNETGQEAWFELDLCAISHRNNKDTDLSFLVECKYHDLNRFWFFLPCETERWCFNDRVFNCAPFQTLTGPLSKSALKLSPLSWRGIVVSKDGTKQDNAVHTAIQQLANAFTPHSLSWLFGHRLAVKTLAQASSSALVPMIVTNADIFRLRPKMTDLDSIRDATAPTTVADQLEWTLCYHDPPMDLYLRNSDAIQQHKKREEKMIERFPVVENRFELWPSRPNWIVVVNIKHLESTVQCIQDHFMSLKTCTTGTALKEKRTVRTR